MTRIRITAPIAMYGNRRAAAQRPDTLPRNGRSVVLRCGAPLHLSASSSPRPGFIRSGSGRCGFIGGDR